MPSRRIHYAWIITGVTFLTLLATAGIRATPSVLIIPLEHEFGWTRVTVSTAVSINLLVYGVCGPFAASLMDRFGVRPVIVVSLGALALAQGAITLMQASWQLDLLWGIVVAAAAGATAVVLAATISSRWFFKRRGLVMGILTSANAAGQLLFLPPLAMLAVTAGWRAVMLLMAGVAVLIALPVLGLMRNFPSDIGLRRFGAPADAAPAPDKPPLGPIAALRLGVRSGDFWFLSISYFICGASTLGLIGTHFIPASVEHGISEVTAASILGVMAVFNIVGTTCSGFLTDRFDNRLLLCVYYLSRGISLLFLPYAYGLGMFGLLGFMIFYGLDWIATVPPTVGLVGKTFGQRNAPVVFGWIAAAHQLGSGFAAFGAGALRTWLGDYQIAFMSSGLLCLIAAGVVIRIGRSSSRPLLPARPLGAGAPA
ncbi:MAG TPA: MFS transporter [Chloroflexota bacterium]|nr:MFS transporter [Chloroflexota bacterium]